MAKTDASREWRMGYRAHPISHSCVKLRYYWSDRARLGLQGRVSLCLILGKYNCGINCPMNELLGAYVIILKVLPPFLRLYWSNHEYPVVSVRILMYNPCRTCWLDCVCDLVTRAIVRAARPNEAHSPTARALHHPAFTLTDCLTSPII